MPAKPSQQDRNGRDRTSRSAARRAHLVHFADLHLPAGSSQLAATVVGWVKGSVEGYMVLDRARGWLTESKFTIVAQSTLKQPFGVASQPTRFEIRLVQSLTLVR